MASFQTGKCLLSLRLREAKMSQQELADKINMSKSQISQYASNTRRMSLDTAKTIAHALRLEKIDDLYEWVRK